MWKIIYAIHRNFRDSYNYATSEIDSIQFVDGDTKEAAEAKLVLETIKNEHFMKRLTDGCFEGTEEFEVIFSGEVLEEDETGLDLDIHPDIVRFIELFKEKRDIQERLTRRQVELDYFESEKELLRRLKKKYEGENETI